MLRVVWLMKVVKARDTSASSIEAEAGWRERRGHWLDR